MSLDMISLVVFATFTACRATLAASPALEAISRMLDYHLLRAGRHRLSVDAHLLGCRGYHLRRLGCHIRVRGHLCADRGEFLEAAPRLSALDPISAILARSLPRKALRASPICPMASDPFTVTSVVRSPLDATFNTSRSLCRPCREAPEPAASLSRLPESAQWPWKRAPRRCGAH